MQMEAAISIYRERFKPSKNLDKPYMMVCLNVVAAESDEEAALLGTSLQQFFLNVVQNSQKALQPPVENMDAYWNPIEKEMVISMSKRHIIGK